MNKAPTLKSMFFSLYYIVVKTLVNMKVGLHSVLFFCPCDKFVPPKISKYMLLICDINILPKESWCCHEIGLDVKNLLQKGFKSDLIANECS